MRASVPGIPETTGRQLIAERYWLLRYAGEELRFTLRCAAERWAFRLTERQIEWQLTWHDENTRPDPQLEESVA